MQTFAVIWWTMEVVDGADQDGGTAGGHGGGITLVGLIW